MCSPLGADAPRWILKRVVSAEYKKLTSWSMCGNILLNAAKHSPSGSEVTLDLKIDSQKISFAVQDQGEGIPEASVPYIFDAFYRADTARNRAAGGTGIGLSLAQALVGMHDGKVHVASVVGAGSTFTINIPNRRENPRKVAERLEAEVKANNTPLGLNPIKST